MSTPDSGARDAQGSSAGKHVPPLSANHTEPVAHRVDSSGYAGHEGMRAATFEFEGTDYGRQPSPAQRIAFKLDFCRDLASIETWATERRWCMAAIAGLRVIVSDRFKISKSLVPAWYGRAGEMEFPTWRVVARRAAIAHELVHVFFPNGNRFLAEGLAVYVQAELGGNPAFPNFDRPLDGLVREHLQEMVPAFAAGDPASLGSLRLADLDRIPTPNPLTLTIGTDFYGEEPRGQARLYPIAGSFVQFLIETRSLDAFQTLYLRTPLVPQAHNPGVPERWRDVYGVGLGELEAAWKSRIARSGEASRERC